VPVFDSVVASQIRAGLGRSDNVVRGDGIFRVRQMHFLKLATQSFKSAESILYSSFYNRIQTRSEPLCWDSDFQVEDILANLSNIIVHRTTSRGGISLVPTCQHLKNCGRIPN